MRRMATLPESSENVAKRVQVDIVYWLMMSKINPVAIAART
jgi:hypothetical protein